MAKKAKKAKKTAKATKKVAKKTKKIKKKARGFPQAKAAAVSRPPSLVSLTHRKMSLAENAATIRPAPCAHGFRSLRLMHMGPAFFPVVSRGPVAPVSDDSPACDFALFAQSFVEGAASGRLQRSFIDDSDR